MSFSETDSHLTTIRGESDGKKVVFVSGNFNVVHPGHLRLLKFAADCGDYLVVGIHADGNPDTFIHEQLRLDSVRSIQFVNQAFILRTPPQNFVEQLMPSVVVKGKEHEARVNPEQEVVEKYGGRIIFGSGELSFSSLDLLNREIREISHVKIRRPYDYFERHGITVAGLRKTLTNFRELRVMVIGDLIVDEYITCDPLGMSQEDPTIVVTPLVSDKFIGGAGIVAAHARGLGAHVNFFSFAGADETAEFAYAKLKEYGVSSHFIVDDSRPTTLKQRFRAGGKTLLRVSHLRQHDVSRELSGRMLEKISAKLPETDLLIFSDFNYGCLPTPLVAEITSLCKARGILMVADSQSSSQIGDVSRFQDTLLLTPTEREARLAVRNFASGLVVLAEELATKARSENIAITLGAEGLLVFSKSGRSGEMHTDRLPSLNTSPRDVSGAGDSLLTCSAMAMAVGADIWQATYLGSLAAACQVSRIGNIPLSVSDLEVEIGL